MDSMYGYDKLRKYWDLVEVFERECEKRGTDVVKLRETWAKKHNIQKCYVRECMNGSKIHKVIVQEMKDFLGDIYENEVKEKVVKKICLCCRRVFSSNKSVGARICGKCKESSDYLSWDEFSSGLPGIEE